MSKILAANWKMYKNRQEVKNFFNEVQTSAHSKVQNIIAASPTLLETLVPLARAKNILPFAQNCFWAKEGAYTGEISPKQLVDLGVSGTLIGHSERRQYFSETTELCCKKIEAALSENLKVIYCVGESLEDRQQNKTESVLENQLQPVFSSLKNSLKEDQFILAYEPVWAIGTGITASLDQIADTHKKIREICSNFELNLSILYGGSVKVDNFQSIASTKNVSGGLVGGASLDAKNFSSLHNCLTDLVK